MHSPTFPGTFSSNYLMYICVDKLQNIYFNMKDTEHVANAFSFSLSETIKGFVFSLTFVC